MISKGKQFSQQYKMHEIARIRAPGWHNTKIIPEIARDNKYNLNDATAMHAHTL